MLIFCSRKPAPGGCLEDPKLHHRYAVSPRVSAAACCLCSPPAGRLACLNMDKHKPHPSREHLPPKAALFLWLFPFLTAWNGMLDNLFFCFSSRRKRGMRTSPRFLSFVTLTNNRQALSVISKLMSRLNFTRQWHPSCRPSCCTPSSSGTMTLV